MILWGHLFFIRWNKKFATWLQINSPLPSPPMDVNVHKICQEVWKCCLRWISRNLFWKWANISFVVADFLFTWTKSGISCCSASRWDYRASPCSWHLFMWRWELFLVAEHFGSTGVIFLGIIEMAISATCHMHPYDMAGPAVLLEDADSDEEDGNAASSAPDNPCRFRGLLWMGLLPGLMDPLIVLVAIYLRPGWPCTHCRHHRSSDYVLLLVVFVFGVNHGWPLCWCVVTGSCADVPWLTPVLICTYVFFTNIWVFACVSFHFWVLLR